MENSNLNLQLRDKGIKNQVLLQAFTDLPRKLFFSKELFPFNQEQITNEDQLILVEPRVISLALMLEQLNIQKEQSILVMGADSVYILAVLSKIGTKVYAVENQAEYAKWAQKVLENIQISNVSIATHDEALGWEEKSPFDVILLLSAISGVQDKLKQQLQIGGKLLAPVGPDWAHVMFEIIQRDAESKYQVKSLKENFFIPNPKLLPEIGDKDYSNDEIIHEIEKNAISFPNINSYPTNELLERIGNAQVVLLGEASHGTSEFYLTRQEITKELIEKGGFNFVCAEADWSDAEQLDHYVKNKTPKKDLNPFTRFPQWMWKNQEVHTFSNWLREYNKNHNNSIGFYGLDLYGLENSIALVIDHLEKIDPKLAALAKERYSCISPYQSDPSIYGKLVLSKQMESCEQEILKMLMDLLKNKNRLDHAPEYFYTYQNANVIVDAERYYKAMYYGSAESWNLRDFHMFHTLKSLLTYFGSDTKAIIWAHNSHIGNALATEMYSRGEINIGHLCKEKFGEKSYHIGFGTNTGTVAAAHNWGDKMDVMSVNTAMPNSYEHLCSKTNIESFTLPLREKDSGEALRKLLSYPKLERAIGVIYRPETERQSHYFHAVLPSQFDEYIWFNQTNAITPLTPTTISPNLLMNHPFGLIDE